jgi:hypothetical protein
MVRWRVRLTRRKHALEHHSRVRQRRFEAIGKSLVYLSHVEDFKYRLSRHWQHLNRAMWKVWHGNLYGAIIALNCFYDGVDIHIMISEEDSSRSTRIEQVRERLAELSVSLKFGI